MCHVSQHRHCGKMAQFPPPDPLDFKQPDWKTWRQRFERFAATVKLSVEAGETQVSTLMYVMGNDSEAIFSSFTFANADDKKDLKKVLDKFGEHFIPKRNIIHERTVFYRRDQQPGESVENYLRTLYSLVEECDFGTKKDEQLRDRLVAGLADRTLSERLQLKSDLTLDLATQMARQSEQVRAQLKEQRNQPRPSTSAAKETDKSNDVSEVRRHSYRGRGRPNGNKFSTRGRSGGTPQKSSNEVCGNCNQIHNNSCPAYRAKCRKCGKIGHYAVCCRSSNPGRGGQGRGRGRHVQEVDVPDVAELSQVDLDDVFFLGSVQSCVDGVHEQPWTVKLKLCGQNVSFKIDSGADVSVMSSQAFRALRNRPSLQPVTRTLKSVGSILKCHGKFDARVKSRGKFYRVTMYVIENAACNLLSRQASQAMDYLQVNLDEVNDSVTYGEIGLMNCPPVKIRLKQDAVPYSVNTARRVSIPLIPKVKSEIDRMLRHGVIAPITEPTEWCAPMVPVVKRNGSVRICVDLKRLNEAVVRERFVLPTLDDLLPKLKGATVFSTLDAASGFWAIPLEESSSKLTTFISPFGRFRFKRLPFGITSAPEIFQRVMADLLQDTEGVVLYMDDILVYGATQAEHDARLLKVMEVIRKSGLKLNKAKCNLRQNSIDFLGHKVDQNGISPSVGKIEAVKNLHPPRNVTELKRVLGMINFLGRYVKNLATVLKPMNDLLKSDSLWQWGPSQDKAFNEVKVLITEAPVLSFCFY